jgi:hypothetical protein
LFEATVAHHIDISRGAEVKVVLGRPSRSGTKG